MQLNWILAALLIWCVVEVTPVAKRVKVGCLGLLPQPLYDAAEKCKMKLPAELPDATIKKQGKRAAKKFVEEVPPKASISASERKAALCVIEKLGIQENGGVTFTATRKWLDGQFAGSTYQKSVLWPKVKKAAEVASNINRSTKDANDMFIDGVCKMYKDMCGSSS